MHEATSWRGVRLYTVGHSTRSLDELITLLHAFDISILVDIRKIPRSLHNPQFGAERLRDALRKHHVRYVHLPALGGLRRARKDSPNGGWRNASFRGFADYMSTDEFEAGLAELRALAATGTVVLMCSEAVPWRCHRSLIADALTARGAHVDHISDAKRAAPHRMTAFAEVHDTRVAYPAENLEYEPLETPGPFHLEATVRVLQRRPTNLVDVWERDRYLRVLDTARGLVLVEVANGGTIDAPAVRFRLLRGDASRATRTEAARTLRRILGLDVDPAPLQRLLSVERRLVSIALALRGMRPPRFPDLFEAFANVIPFQQVSLDAGVAIVRRLVERFGRSLAHDGQKRHAFPTARAIASAQLAVIRACGLSAKKAEALRGVALAIESGELTERQLSRLSSIEAMRLLTELPGIGPWSAGVVLLRGLGRVDVFPAADVGAIRGLTGLMRLTSRSALDQVIERFGEHRGYLYFCSLGGSLLAKDLIHGALGRAESPPSGTQEAVNSIG